MKNIFTSKDVKKCHLENILSFVFDVFNELLTENYNDNSVSILQDDVIENS